MTSPLYRGIIFAGPILGILAASVFWLISTRPRSAVITDAKAHALGYASARRYTAVHSLWAGRGGDRDFSEAEFHLLDDVVRHDSLHAQVAAIIPFARARRLDEKQRALAILLPRAGDKGLSSSISYVLRAYAQGNGRTAVVDWTRYQRGAARRLAIEAIKQAAVHESPARRPGRLRP